MRNRLYLIVALLVVLSVSISACAPQATPEPEAVETKAAPEETGPVLNAWGKELPADAAPPEEQVLTLPCYEGSDLDVMAHFYQASGSCGGDFLWEPLTLLDPNNNLIPGAAASWEQSADGLSWTFHLREGIKWSDGSPVTAKDFEYSLKRALTPETGNSFAWYFFDIKNSYAIASGEMDPDELGVTAKDDQTLVIETEAQCQYLPQLMVSPASCPVPHKILEKVGDQWVLDPETALSNGPWKLEEWSPGRQTVLVPNEHYVGDYKPYVEKLVLLHRGDDSDDFPAYQAGDVDGLFADASVMPLSLEARKMAEGDSALQEQLAVCPAGLQTRYLFFDTNVEPWSDKRVRQAIAHAINRQTTVDVVLGGLGAPASGMLPPGMPGYSDAVKEFQYYDLELAQQLLAEAGYPNGEGFPDVELWYEGGEAVLNMTGEVVQGMLKDNLGIEITLRPTEDKVFNTSLGEGQIDFAIEDWTFDYVDPSNFLNVFVPSLGRHKDWNNADYNKLVEAAAAHPNYEERLDMYRQADLILSEELGGVFLHHQGRAQIWKPYVIGIPTSASGCKRVPYFFTGLQNLYVAQH